MITDIPDMSNIELYCHETEALWVNVWAEIKDGKLTVQGQDLGGVVEEWFGSDEFEYRNRICIIMRYEQKSERQLVTNNSKRKRPEN